MSFNMYLEYKAINKLTYRYQHRNKWTMFNYKVMEGVIYIVPSKHVWFIHSADIYWTLLHARQCTRWWIHKDEQTQSPKWLCLGKRSRHSKTSKTMGKRKDLGRHRCCGSPEQGFLVQLRWRDASQHGQRPEESLKQGWEWSSQGANRGKEGMTGTVWVKAKNMNSPSLRLSLAQILYHLMGLKTPHLMPPDPISAETWCTSPTCAPVEADLAKCPYQQCHQAFVSEPPSSSNSPKWPTQRERGGAPATCSLGLLEKMELFLWPHTCESTRKVIL